MVLKSMIMKLTMMMIMTIIAPIIMIITEIDSYKYVCLYTSEGGRVPEKAARIASCQGLFFVTWRCVNQGDAHERLNQQL